MAAWTDAARQMGATEINPTAVAGALMSTGAVQRYSAGGLPVAKAGAPASTRRAASCKAGGQAAEPLALPRWNGRAKRAADVVGAAILLLFAAPVMALIALLIRASDGGPALVGHTRVGRGGASFRCLKFRSMVVDADKVLARLIAEDPAAREEWAISRKLRDDPRVTRLGRVLRASSLDEVPQLINVLRGEMSLVGPRPVVADEIAEHYGADAADYYLAVRPGITGLWQVSGRSTKSYAERVALDVDYVRRMSPARDAAILLRTVAVVLVRRGAY